MTPILRRLAATAALAGALALSAAVPPVAQASERTAYPSTAMEGLPYSGAVATGDMVFVGGVLGTVRNRKELVPGGITPETRQALAYVREMLEQAGSSFADVVRVHYIYPNRDDFEPCWPVFQKYLGESRPAATVFVAGLLDDAMKLEIEVTARVRG